MVSYANCLICIFINFNENMKNGKTRALKIHKLTNFMPKLPLWHFVIELVRISYDKFIDYLVLYKECLICIFKKLIQMSESEEKRGKTISIAKYCIRYKAYIAFQGQILKAVSVVRGTTLNAIKYCPRQ